MKNHSNIEPQEPLQPPSFDQHISTSIYRIACLIVGAIVFIVIFLYAILPCILRLINESSLEKIENSLILIVTHFGFWITGYWCPTLPFIPRK